MKQLTMLFLLQEGQLLLAMKKRGFGAGRWNGVGGKVEPDETIPEAAVRECQEEIGVTPLSYSKAAEITFDELHNGIRKQMHVHVFLCTEWEGSPRETEEMAPKWFNITEIPYDEMWSDDIFWLPKILKGKKLRCTFTMDDNDQVSSYEIVEVGSLGEQTAP